MERDRAATLIQFGRTARQVVQEEDMLGPCSSLNEQKHPSIPAYKNLYAHGNEIYSAARQVSGAELVPFGLKMNEVKASLKKEVTPEHLRELTYIQLLDNIHIEGYSFGPRENEKDKQPYWGYWQNY